MPRNEQVPIFLFAQLVGHRTGAPKNLRAFTALAFISPMSISTATLPLGCQHVVSAHADHLGGDFGLAGELGFGEGEHVYDAAALVAVKGRIGASALRCKGGKKGYMERCASILVE